MSREKCQEFFLCLWIDLLAVSGCPTFWPGAAVRKRLPGCAVEPLTRWSPPVKSQEIWVKSKSKAGSHMVQLLEVARTLVGGRTGVRLRMEQKKYIYEREEEETFREEGIQGIDCSLKNEITVVLCSLSLQIACVVLSSSVVSDSLQPQGLKPTRLLCSWGFSKRAYWSGLPCPPLEKGKATHYSILAWRIPWTVQSMRSQRVGHD